MGHVPPPIAPVAGACVSAGAPARLLVQFTTVSITMRKKCTIPRKITSGQTNSWLSEILPPHHMKTYRKPLWRVAQGGEADKKPVPTRELLACPPSLPLCPQQLFVITVWLGHPSPSFCRGKQLADIVGSGTGDLCLHTTALTNACALHSTHL